MGRSAAKSLGCRVRFRQTWCGFELPHRLADRRIESADPETRRIAAKYLESNYLPRTASLSDRVAELTRRLLPTGQCSVDAIADQLAMHPRSRQRGLATEGVGCQDPAWSATRSRAPSITRADVGSGRHLGSINGTFNCEPPIRPEPPLAVDSHEETSRPNAGRAHWPELALCSAAGGARTRDQRIMSPPVAMGTRRRVGALRATGGTRSAAAPAKSDYGSTPPGDGSPPSPTHGSGCGKPSPDLTHHPPDPTRKTPPALERPPTE